MTTPPDRTNNLPLPPEHDALCAANWHHTPTYCSHHYMHMGDDTLTRAAQFDRAGWTARIYLDDVCVSNTNRHPTHADAVAALRDVATALLALPEVPQ